MHDSDCAVHNMPAYPNGPCDCGAKLQDNQELVDILQFPKVTVRDGIITELSAKLILVELARRGFDLVKRT